MGYRHRGRRRALQCLYQWESNGADMDLGLLLGRFWRSQEEDEEVRVFAERLVRGTVARVAEIDPMVEAQAEHWRLERMGVVDRTILRLGVYELLEESETPAAVVIDEAIELAKRFSGEGAGQFVNGILDGIRKRIEKDRAETAGVASAPASPSGSGEVGDG